MKKSTLISLVIIFLSAPIAMAKPKINADKAKRTTQSMQSVDQTNGNGRIGSGEVRPESIFSVPTRNVQVGGETSLDACGGSGVVIVTTSLFGLKNGVLSLSKVEVNQKAYACDEDDENQTIGIVFGAPGQDCKISSPIPKRQDYKGPCKSGWIKKEFYLPLAG